MVRILFTPSAERDYKKLPFEIKERVKDALDGGFAMDPLAEEFHAKKLAPPLPGYRVRVGEYRILFTLESDFVRIYRIKNRKDAYR